MNISLIYVSLHDVVGKILSNNFMVNELFSVRIERENPLDQFVYSPISYTLLVPINLLS